MFSSEAALSERGSWLASGWWAIYTRHQHEKTIAEMLAAKGCEVFLPSYEVMRRWKDRKMKVSLPLFPCYVFMRSDRSRRLQVVTTPGVHEIVRRGEQFAEVGSEEIEALRRAVHGAFRLEPHPYLQCGERVRVTHGPLEGVEGILMRKKNLCRLVLSVELLNRAAALEIDAADVAPVSVSRCSVYAPADFALRLPSVLEHGSGIRP